MMLNLISVSRLLCFKLFNFNFKAHIFSVAEQRAKQIQLFSPEKIGYSVFCMCMIAFGYFAFLQQKLPKNFEVMFYKRILTLIFSQ